MKGRTEMDRDMAGKQTEAYELMMIDDRQGDTESGPALSQRVSALSERVNISVTPAL